MATIVVHQTPRRRWRFRISSCSSTIAALLLAVIASRYSSLLAQSAPEVVLQLGHSAPITALAFSPDGTYLVSGSEDSTIKVWRVSTGQLVRTLSDHTAAINSVSFSRSGHLVASASEDRTVKIWDLANGYALNTYMHEPASPTAVSFLSEDARILSTTSDGTVVLRDLSTGAVIRVVRPFVQRPKIVTRILASADGDTLAGLDSDGRRALWRAAKTKTLKLPTASERAPTTATFSTDGKLFVYASGERELTVVDAVAGRRIRSFTLDSSPSRAIAVSPDKRVVLVALGEEIVSFDLLTGTVADRFVLRNGESKSLLSWMMFRITQGLMPDRVWPKEMLRRLAAVNIMAFSIDGLMAIGGDDGDVRVRHFSKGASDRVFDTHARTVHCLAVSADGHQIFTGGSDGTIQMWNANSGTLSRVFRGHVGSVDSIALTKSGAVLVSGGDDRTVKVWNTATGELLKTFTGHQAGVTAVAIAPDDNLVLTGDVLGLGYVWRLKDDTSVGPFKSGDLTGDVKSVSFGPSGDIFLAYGTGTVAVIRVDKGELRLFKEPDFPIRDWAATERNAWRMTLNGTAAFSADGHHAVSGDLDGSLHYWNLDTGAETRRIRRDRAGLSSPIALSPDGRSVLAFDDSGGGVLWNLATGKPRRALTNTNSSGMVSAAVITADGRYAVSGYFDGTTRLWDLSTGREVVRLVGLADDNWAIATPEGYYSGSEHGADRLGVRVGTQLFGMDQFYDAFYRPDLVERRLRGDDIGSLSSNRPTIEAALRAPPPRVTILAPTTRTRTTERFSDVSVRIEDQGGAIGDVRIHHNGKLVDSMGIYRLDAQSRGPGNQVRHLADVKSTQGVVARTFRVRLIHGTNTISAVAFNGENTVLSPMRSVVVDADLPTESPRLFVLAVGNSHFTDRSYNLRMSGKDARDVVAHLRKLASASTYATVVAETLQDASKDQLNARIAALSREMGPQDVFVLYMASHGRTDDDVHYVYTAEFDGTHRAATTISSVELLEMSKSVPALKQVVILDTCYAGGIEPAVAGLYDSRIAVLAKALGMHALTATKTFQEAQDDFEGNGLFTHFLLHGLGGAADANRDGLVTVSELASYVTPLVKRASGGTQEPFARHFGDDIVLTSTR